MTQPIVEARTHTKQELLSAIRVDELNAVAQSAQDALNAIPRLSLDDLFFAQRIEQLESYVRELENDIREERLYHSRYQNNVENLSRRVLDLLAKEKGDAAFKTAYLITCLHSNLSENE